MRLHLPKKILAALAAAFLTTAAVTLATGSVVYGVEDITGNTPINKASSGTYSGFNVSSGATLAINNGSGGADNRPAGSTVTLGATTIAAGGKLSLWSWTERKLTYSSTDKVTIAGDITLNGSSSTAATLYVEDGSYNFSGKITVVNKGLIESKWAKGYTIQNLTGDTSADLTFQRNNNDKAPDLFYLAGANEYAGTVTLLNNTATADKPDAWNNLVIGHAEALKNAAVNLGTATTAEGNVRNALELNVASASIRALSGVGTVRLRSVTDEKLGAAALTSAALTITGSDNGVFSGTIARGVDLVIDENASQIFSNVNFGSAVTNNGTLTLRGHLNVTDTSDMVCTGLIRPDGDGFFSGTYTLISGSDSATLTATDFSGVQRHGVDLDSSAYSCTGNTLTATMQGTTYQIATQKTSTELTGLGATEVTGSGILVTGAAQSLGGLRLASDWTGTVQLSGAGTDMSFSKGTLANDFSTIELKGVSGWLTSNATSNANLILSDNGSTYALTVDNGTSGALHTFSGAITGSGTWAEVTNKGYRMTFKFTGDISAWKGQYVSNRSGVESYISFVNNVGGSIGLEAIRNLGSKYLTVGIQHSSGVTMNGDFKREGSGALNLFVGTAYSSYKLENNSLVVESVDSATSATFGGKDVTLSKLNISTSSSATFQTTSPEALAADNTKTSSVTIDQLTGAGNLVLKTATSEYASSSFTVSSMQGYTGSVSIVKTENGGSFTETPELSTGGGTAVTMSSLSLTGGARAKISAVQNLTINSLSSTGTNKLDVSVGNYATMSAITTTDLSLGVVNLSGANSAALSIRRDNSTGSISIDELQVVDNGTVNIRESANSGKGWNTTVNIAKLTNGSSVDASVVTLTNAARAGTSFYNIDGGNFNGEIVVKGMATNGTRRTAVQLNNAAAVEGTLITFNAGSEANNKLGLGVNADVALAGIQHASGSSVSSVIYSGKMTASDTDFASQGTDVHTITLTGGGTYTTSAKLASLLNISMSGSGSQSFTGDMSAFNGSLSVSAGSLNITNNVAAASQINVSGGTLTFDGSVGAADSVAAPATVKGGKLEVKGTYYGSLTQQGGEAVIASLSGNGALTSSAGTATVSNATGFSGVLEATGGSVTVSSASSLSALKATNGSTLNAKGITASDAGSATGGLSVAELVIGAGSTVQAWGTGDTWTKDAEATVLMRGSENTPVTLTVGTAGQTGASTLNANLVLDGATVTLNNALTMGSTLTLNNVNLINWDALVAANAGGGPIVLFTSVDSLTLGSGDSAVEAKAGTEYAASKAFSNTNMDNYRLQIVGSTKNYTVQMVKNAPTPEPTTATLSLLALMGLAARRRRKA